VISPRITARKIWDKCKICKKLLFLTYLVAYKAITSIPGCFPGIFLKNFQIFSFFSLTLLDGPIFLRYVEMCLEEMVSGFYAPFLKVPPN
jgi:hypothetical protein